MDAASYEREIENVIAWLVKEGRLTQAALNRARGLQNETTERLPLILTRLGLVPEQDLLAAYTSALGIPLATPRDYPEAPVMPERLSGDYLRKVRVVPMSADSERLQVALADPTDADTLQALRFVSKRHIDRYVTLPSIIDTLLTRLYGPSALGAPSGESSDLVHRDDIERLQDASSEAPVIRLVNNWITEAVQAQASDIHIEPLEELTRVRFRVDGLLREVNSVRAQLHTAIISRIKIMAQLNIAERRLAQDGRLRLAVGGRDIDIRVSIVPTVRGESIVLRILDRGNVALDFEALGFDELGLERFRKGLERRHGIMLVTGPTGSGKTTSLYASVMHLNNGTDKILTVEDPVEYQLQGINQTQVLPQIGLTFASALRSFLRHDPNIMMVGEIRDLETGQIAVQAALTGHRVLSTLHTNDSAGAVTRLLDMGIENFLITATVNGVAAQRLVRKLCMHCREPHELPPEIDLTPLMPVRVGLQPVSIYRATGCPRCNGTGYAGRTVIMEVLLPDDVIRRLVMQKAPADVIRQAAINAGMETMYHNGLRKCLTGMTSLDEVMRVTRGI